ncbi:MAG: tetratricopeptide repeat protein [Myxococcota bacterium]
MTKEDLKGDQFVSFATVVLEWITKYRVQVLAAVAGLVVLVAAVETGSWWVARKDAAASKLLFQALSLASGGEDGEKSADKTAALNEYRNLIAQYPSSDPSRLAQLQIASILLSQSDNDGAIAAVDAYLKSASEKETFYQMALELKGYALMNKNDTKGAADLFRKMIDAKRPIARDYALYDLAFALEKGGDKKGAAEALRRITAEFPKSTLREKATAMANTLDPATPGDEAAAKK